MPNEKRSCFVYICKSKEGQILYIGCANDIEARMRQHRSACWHSSVHSIDKLKFEDREQALSNERKLIKDLRPQHNISDNYQGSKTEFFCRLGMSNELIQRIELWRCEQLAKTKRIPSQSEAIRQLINHGLTKPKRQAASAAKRVNKEN